MQPAYEISGFAYKQISQLVAPLPERTVIQFMSCYLTESQCGQGLLIVDIGRTQGGNLKQQHKMSVSCYTETECEHNIPIKLNKF